MNTQKMPGFMGDIKVHGLMRYPTLSSPSSPTPNSGLAHRPFPGLSYLLLCGELVCPEQLLSALPVALHLTHMSRACLKSCSQEEG